MPDFGKLTSVDIREMWPHEARDFTPWLSENIGQLSEALGMDLEVVQIESDVGAFALDVLAKDLGTDRNVVIENQFGVTDHDHLGKLITYAADKDASAVVWLTEDVRDEHRQALEWLNRRTDAAVHFFAVVVEVIRIDQSRPAVLFKPVVLPSDWQGSAVTTDSPGGARYRRYFQALIDELRDKHHFTGARAAQPQSWYSFASGVRGFTYGTSFAKGGLVRAEMEIRADDTETNKRLFDDLLARKSEIEKAFQGALAWERMEGRQAARVATYRDGSIDSSDEDLAEIRAWAIGALLSLKRVLHPYLVELRAKLGTPRHDAG